MTVPPDRIADYHARAEAARAHLRQDGHEVLCGERYKNLSVTLERLEKSGTERHERINSVYRLLWTGMVALVTLLLSIVGFLTTRALF